MRPGDTEIFGSRPVGGELEKIVRRNQGSVAEEHRDELPEQHHGGRTPQCQGEQALEPLPAVVFETRFHMESIIPTMTRE